MSRSDVSTTQRNLPEFSQWVGAMRLEADVADNEDFDPATILQAILSAGTFEEAVELQSSSLLSGKNITNRVHTIYSFEVRQSDSKYTDGKDRSLGVYFIVHAAWEDGTQFTYGVGAANVLAILWQARQFDKLPGKFQLTGRDTDAGTLLSLMPVKVSVKA